MIKSNRGPAVSFRRLFLPRLLTLISRKKGEIAWAEITRARPTKNRVSIAELFLKMEKK
jgi:hypothetical protein